MKHRQLANTDLTVSPACMGTMTFGSQVDPDEAKQMVDRCIDAGINFFDTANVYNQGRSEEILGEALAGRRESVIVASKVRGAMGTPTGYVGLSRAAIRQAIEDSLRRLKTDYLDLYYLHMPDYETPIEESLDAMEELVQEGKVLYPATSNYSAWQMYEIFAICERNGYASPWVAQPMYNLAARGIEQEYLAFTERLGISNVVYNPLAGGLLTGKQPKEGEPIPGTRFDGNQMYLDRFWHDAYFEAVEDVTAIAERAGLTPVELAFAWLREQKRAHCVILGASSLAQLEQNLAAFSGDRLSSETLNACDRVWQKLRGPTPEYNR